MWDERYSQKAFAFGTEPNDFLATMAERIPQGRVLSLAEGEGRNGTFLAGLGYDVVGVDSSPVGLAKAARLAEEHRVDLTTIVADLARFPIEPESWEGIVSIFCHLPPDVRQPLHAAVVAGLKPGGVLILESYTPKQLEFGTGGPKTPERTMTLEALQRELAGLDLVHARELEREVCEGIYHTGHAAVVQVVGVKPAQA